MQLCGDAHLSNIGVFAAPDRRLVFSINDFDETFAWRYANHNEEAYAALRTAVDTGRVTAEIGL